MSPPKTSVTSALARKPHDARHPGAVATSVTQKLLALQPPSVTQPLPNGVVSCGGCRAKLTKEHWSVQVNGGQVLCAKCAAYHTHSR